MPNRSAILLFLTALAHPTEAGAQTYSAGTDLFFYGDNTEFTNPFRAGDTTFGVSGRVFLDAKLNDAVTLKGGLFGLGRFGSHEFLEHAEPVIALQLSHGASRFIFGSLETTTVRHDISGPDHETPHRLLPPIQQENLTFTRGQEMGLQWLVDSARFEHDTWINWQRLNTPTHRERFDAGYRGSMSLPASMRLHGQWHIAHEGGQLFQSGSVVDSQAAALGLEWSHIVGRVRTVFDTHAVITENIPNRNEPSLTQVGLGMFARGAVQHGAWRGHLIVWRSRDTLKSEGDPNYLAQQLDGTMIRKVRDYGEFGVTRHLRPAEGVHMFASFRLHRIESHYEYSYRIVARLKLRRNF